MSLPITSYFAPVSKPSTSHTVKRPRNFSGEASASAKRPAHHKHGQASRKEKLVAIADSTLQAIEAGVTEHDNATHGLTSPIRVMKEGTKFYSPTDTAISTWSSSTPPSLTDNEPTQFSIVDISTMDGARLLSSSEPQGKIGILNFASATKPGGGFLRGASAQEESIARSSTLYPSLMSSKAQQFYQLHLRHKQAKSSGKKASRDGDDRPDIVREEAYYTHAIIYSPGVLLLKDDAGSWMAPCEVDVLTSAAVNAGVVRRENTNAEPPLDDAEVEAKIASVMRERMARILFVFEQMQVREIVLGSFGTGVFKNRVDLVAQTWAELLGVGAGQDSNERGSKRFQHSFSKVVFAILGRETFETFETAFWAK